MRKRGAASKGTQSKLSRSFCAKSARASNGVSPAPPYSRRQLLAKAAIAASRVAAYP
jgi:hypothetical protein